MKQERISAGDFALNYGTAFFALILVLLVAGIGATLVLQSFATIREFGLNFWRTEIWDPVAENFGAFPFIWGTLYSSLMALVIPAPISLGVAVFTSELCPHWLQRPVIFTTELLAAIPSIVYGMWGIFVLVPAVRSLQLALPDWVRAIPFFSGPPVGVSMFTAIVVLSIMVIPFTSSVAREVIKAVPLAQRETAYALGATRWEVTKVIIHHARVGIIGAIMLGLGRALGETMAVTMVIGNTPRASWSLFAQQYTMSAVIANEFTEAATDLHISALIEIGLVLFIVTFIVNAASRMLIWNMARESRRPSPIAQTKTVGVGAES